MALLGRGVFFFKQVLAAKRLIANFLEVSAVHRCAEHVISSQSAGAGQRGGGGGGRGSGGVFSNIICNIISASLTKWWLDD